MKPKDLAEHLGISKSRVSQIFNDGEINFGIEKIIEISLKRGMILQFYPEDKSTVYAEKFVLPVVSPGIFFQKTINQKVRNK